MITHEETYQIICIDQNYHKLIGILLSRLTNTTQKINFAEKLEKENGAKMFFIAEKQKKAILNFSLD